MVCPLKLGDDWLTSSAITIYTTFLSVNLVQLRNSSNKPFTLWQKYIFEKRKHKIQSTLVISKSKGPSETLRDIRTSDVQNWGKYQSNNHISQMNMKFDSFR